MALGHGFNRLAHIWRASRVIYAAMKNVVSTNRGILKSEALYPFNKSCQQKNEKAAGGHSVALDPVDYFHQRQKEKASVSAQNPQILRSNPGQAL